MAERQRLWSGGHRAGLEGSPTNMATTAEEEAPPTVPTITVEGEPINDDLAVTSEEQGTNGTNKTGGPVNPPITNWQTPQTAAHPKAAEIIHQVEFYFGDDNLSQDAHLLGLIREGKGTVSLNEITGFRKMRQFRPKTAVREALKQSTFLELSADGKRIRRKTPLGKRMTVKPKINLDRQKKTIPEDKPWLTRGMMKATGFEEYATDGPIRPAEYEQDREDYAEDVSFTTRIETAVARFSARRKMHQETRQIFSRYMIYGGMEGGQNMFTGGALSKEETEGLSRKEIAEKTAYYGVSERVLDGFDVFEGEDTWHVDFEATAKGFLSSQLMDMLNWHDQAKVETATNVLRSFYNYLLLHDVCPKYKDQLMRARKVCDLAEEELPKLAIVDKSLPGGFNTACSTLFGGNYAGLHAEGDWVVEGDDVGWTMADAKKIFLTGVAAYGTEEQFAAVENNIANTHPFQVISTENLGLEITGMDFMTEEAKQIYDDSRLSNTIVKPMGRLHCVRWDPPHAPSMDMPKSALKAKKGQEFDFVMDEEILKSCYPGLKMEVCVKELDIGIKWIDYLETSYASFFTWLVNEDIREWKEPGLPKGYMTRQPDGMGMEVAEVSRDDEGDGQNDYDDEEPD
ncbi:uncharacterized protein LTR77_009287 [Saxophila tyrrhenica]|uniref:HTH La-type RNA-binding domain-containing protein n=1 Tax=Saxophila tyrrhenica TaxID=1690608 RepID=A0AAV9NYT3_9PEZI|nr:hypothetical protein LTR77_009287 [Saxophila tyrrhenica]